MSEKTPRTAPTDTNWKQQEIEAHKKHVEACRTGQFKTPATGGTFDRKPSGELVEMHREHDENGQVVSSVPMADHLAKQRAQAARTSPAPAASQAPSKAE